MTTATAPQPFKIEITDSELQDLHRRLDATRWPDPAPDGRTDFARGVPLAYLQELAAYWRQGFDWRVQEARLNEIPQFVAEIDGQQIHYLHMRSPEPDALPLLITHGYPSSVVEFLDLIGPLSDPRSYGGDPRDAFDVVVPSVPGFGFSTPVLQPGWELGRTTAAFAELMARLGYSRYGAHGGDIGAGVSGRLGATDAAHVVGTIVVSDPGSLGLAGEQFPIPDYLTEEDRARVEQERTTWRAERGYLDLQSHRPETIAAALTDSPVGQLAWIVEKFQTWTNPASKTPDEAVDRDQLLTNVSLYWFTRSGATAARFLSEAAHSNLDWVSPSGVPSGWVVFNTEPIMRRFMDPQHQMAYWNEHSEGGHFAAMEEPKLLVDDLRAFFRDLH
ncbi:MAG TPA: epoxide hydrolase [Propionibacteriaceae bacterium]|nr:epoxide hydrolase [Propionibacteriaceae bacterium]